jgi:hypothetical protein
MAAGALRRKAVLHSPQCVRVVVVAKAVRGSPRSFAEAIATFPAPSSQQRSLCSVAHKPSTALASDGTRQERFLRRRV